MRLALHSALLAAALLHAGAAPASAPVAATDPCAGIGADGGRRIPVSSASELDGALLTARPGDAIALAPGRYRGNFVSSASGTAEAPIALCGPADAELTKGRTDGGGFALIIRGSWWTLAGFTVTDAQQGVRIEGGSHDRIVGLAIQRIGQEALSIKKHSSHNEVRATRIRDTGRHDPRYGEGIYIGTAPSQWCQWTACGPDRSDSNRIVADTIGPGIGSDPVDVKAGTVGTMLDSNVIDASGSRNLKGDRNWTGGLAIINGRDVLVRWNRGRGAAFHGFSVQSDGAAKAYPATGARFIGNEVDLGDAPGEAILVGWNTGAVVACDNRAPPGRLAKVPCREP